VVIVNEVYKPKKKLVEQKNKEKEKKKKHT